MPAPDNSVTSAQGFYESALSRAERMRLPTARTAQGVDEEIALLRLRLHSLATTHPEQLDLLLKGIHTLVRALALKYKLSGKPEEDLWQNVVGVLKGIGGVTDPEHFHESQV